EKILADINHLIAQLTAIRGDINLYFLEITPTAFRVDRNNNDIRLLNQYLKDNLAVKWISLDQAFSDKYGKLDLSYSDDGLHLNAKGYEKLTAILEKELN
ncbi:TPA: acylneuraminate cytidylyltransferase, partial [Mannheimia haemolytica]|nr:acylneuraminate cytidylyltransferase [Mannheimia haemolytica]